MRYKIAMICQPEYFRFCYENDLKEFGDIYEFKYHFGMSETDFIPLCNFQADINIFFRGERVPLQVLEQLKGIKVNLSSEPFPGYIDGKFKYTKDSLIRYLDFRQIRALPYDYVFHYDAASLNVMGKDGLLLSGAFPFPVATGTYHPVQMKNRWDFFFIGRSTIHRERYFGYLKHRYNFLHICHGIWGPELVEYMQSSKICINVHAEDEISWEPRMQMMLACGVFVISEKITPNDILRPGIDYIEIGNRSELREAAVYYLHHESERKQIAESGYRQVCDKLDSKIVFKKLFDDILANRIQKFSVGKRSRLYDVVQLFI